MIHRSEREQRLEKIIGNIYRQTQLTRLAVFSPVVTCFRNELPDMNYNSYVRFNQLRQNKIHIYGHSHQFNRMSVCAFQQDSVFSPLLLMI